MHDPWKLPISAKHPLKEYFAPSLPHSEDCSEGESPAAVSSPDLQVWKLQLIVCASFGVGRLDNALKFLLKTL
jgi:hypothetical protein